MVPFSSLSGKVYAIPPRPFGERASDLSATQGASRFHVRLQPVLLIRCRETIVALLTHCFTAAVLHLTALQNFRQGETEWTGKESLLN